MLGAARNDVKLAYRLALIGAVGFGLAILAQDALARALYRQLGNMVGRTLSLATYEQYASIIRDGVSGAVGGLIVGAALGLGLAEQRDEATATPAD